MPRSFVLYFHLGVLWFQEIAKELEIEKGSEYMNAFLQSHDKTLTAKELFLIRFLVEISVWNGTRG